jgi:uncharacterized membrane protein YeiH
VTTVSAPETRIAARAYLVVDLAATALFGFEGAAQGSAAGATPGAATGLDLLGVTVIGFSTALVGGILRDLLLGDAPPAAFRSPSRIVAALIGSLAGFAFFVAFRSTPEASLLVLDAAALALFAVTGAEKAAGRGSNLWVVTILGAITGVGGGVVRDLLLSRVPVVLVGNVYATAAAAGALATGIALRLKVPPVGSMAIGFAVCFGLRLAAIAFNWQLPRP